MAVRKRTWISGGEEKSAWIVDYFDQNRVRCQETFARKKEADARWIEVGHEVREGTHTARSRQHHREGSGRALAPGRQAGRAREARPSSSTRGTSRHHIIPLIGRAKLADLTTPRVQKFADDLLTRPKADDFDETMSREHGPQGAGEPEGHHQARAAPGPHRQEPGSAGLDPRIQARHRQDQGRSRFPEQGRDQRHPQGRLLAAGVR